MELEPYLGKIYIIKAPTTPPVSNLQQHYARWVSPRVRELRIDRYIDIPYVNVTFIEAYARGDYQNGERFLDLAATSFPGIIRVPFSALSPNEFRFPSKNVDYNIRHVVIEILRNARFLAMSEEMFKFLSGRQVHCLETNSLVQAYISSVYAGVKDRVPLKCEACQKFIWIEHSKLPDKPVKTKCPACSNQIVVQRPAEMDFNLARFLSTSPSGGQKEKTGELLLGSTGEFQRKNIPSAVPAGIDLDLDLQEILGPTAAKAESPVPAPAAKAPQPAPPHPEQPVPPAAPKPLEPAPAEDMAELFESIELVSTPTPAATPAPEEPGASPGAEAYSLLDDLPGLKLDQPAAPAASPTGGETVPQLDLGDDFFNEILPDSKPAAAESAPAQLSTMEEDSSLVKGSSESDMIITDVFRSGGEERRCHVCGAAVGSEQVCPKCFAEQAPPDMSLDGYQPAEESGVEIRLKEIKEEAHETAAQATGSGEVAAGPMSFWEEPVWSVKIGDEVYENLDMRTIEDWILQRSLIQTDQVRKGEAKWAEAGSVPYFKQAFKQAQEEIQLGSTDASSSFSPAPEARRIAALVIDLIICLILAIIGRIAIGFSIGGEGCFSGMLKIAATVLIPYLYLSFTNGVMGRTIGKAICRLAVINTEGKPIGLANGMKRTAVWLFTFGFGFFMALGNPKKQAFHDKIAQSYVIQLD